MVLVELVGEVGAVKQNNKNKIVLSIVVDPVCSSGRDGNDISLSEFLDLLVAILERLSTFTSLKLLLRYFICLRATRQRHSLKTLP